MQLHSHVAATCKLTCARKRCMLYTHRVCTYMAVTVQNEEAEEVMRHVEQAEEEAAASNPDALQLHLCIINLVIGTLYCSKVRLCEHNLCLGQVRFCCMRVSIAALHAPAARKRAVFCACRCLA